jgi:BirA family biotin operon repressor/biotin-[acetyl-CoA-carboxylase] ligase
MEKLSAQRIRPFLTGTIGKELQVYQVIDSTNTAAKLLAKNGAPHGAVVIAAQQTAGRGRQGRIFYSPPDAGLYLSIILRPHISAEESLLITPAAAVAVARAIAHTTGVQVQIKWVNDLYYQGKKLCGILTESALDGYGGVAYAVLGIGINLLNKNFPPELQEIATSLAAAGTQPDRNLLAAAILSEFDKIYVHLEDKEFLEEYRSRSCVIGKQVALVYGEKQQTVMVHAIDDHANLVVSGTDGVPFLVGCGEVSLKGDWK